MSGETLSDPRFQVVAANYERWKAELEAGRMSQTQFDQALEAAAIEHEGRWWMIGANSGKWYVSEGQQWREATPPSVATRESHAPNIVVNTPIPNPSAPPVASPGGTPAQLPRRQSSGIGLLIVGAVIAAAGVALSTTGTGLSLIILILGAGLFSLELMRSRRIPAQLFLPVAAVCSAAGFIGFAADVLAWWVSSILSYGGLASLLGGLLGLVLSRASAGRGLG